MKLYLLETKGLGHFYIVSIDPTNAEKTLTDNLDKADYGFTSDRVVLNIEVLAKEISCFPKDKLNFSSGDNLIINPSQ